MSARQTPAWGHGCEHRRRTQQAGWFPQILTKLNFCLFVFFGIKKAGLLKGSLVYWLSKIMQRGLRVKAQCVPSCFCLELIPVLWVLVSHHIKKHFWHFCSCSGNRQVARGKVLLWIRNWDQCSGQQGILVVRFLNYLATVWKGAKGWSDNICRVYKHCKLNQLSIRVTRATPDWLSYMNQPSPGWNVFIAALAWRCCRTRKQIEITELESGLCKRKIGWGGRREIERGKSLKGIVLA